MIDVTEKLLQEACEGYGDLVKMARRAVAPSKLSDSLLAVIEKMSSPGFDTTMGHVSHALLYSRMFRGMSKTFHRDVIRLLKGRILLVFEMEGVGHGEVADPNSNAAKETPYHDKWYSFAINPEKFGELR